MESSKNWAPDLKGRKRAPKYAQIAEALIEDIAQGKLRPGDQLPPQRDLAAVLQVTVGTVARAFAEVMRAGHIEAGFRRGTRVVERAPEAERPVVSGEAQVATRVMVDLRGHQAALTQWRDVVSGAMSVAGGGAHMDEALRYGEVAGSARHREAGVMWLGKAGAAPAAADVIVTNGAQHGLLCALLALCAPGEAIATESLTYSGLRAVAPFLNLRLVPIAIDEHGLIPDSFDRACRENAIKALVCVPTIQNPTTVTLPAERRADIVGIARRHGVQIVEDDVYGGLAGGEFPPLCELAPERVVRLASFSKELGPGLRAGYLQAPAGLATRITDAVRATTWMADPVAAEIAAALVLSGEAAGFLEANRTELKRRNEAFYGSLGGKPAAYAEASPHAWVELPPPWTSQQFVSALLDQGYRVSSSDAFSTHRDFVAHGVRISVSAAGSVGELARLGGIMKAVIAGLPGVAGGDGP